MPVIALIDGLLPRAWPGLKERVAFHETQPYQSGSPATSHAMQMALAIRRNAPDAEFESLGVFAGSLACSVSSVCDALAYAAQSDASIVHCSFGLGRDVPELGKSVARILASGKFLVASAPARGAVSFPAAYEGVIAVQGDARCTPGQWSHLNLSHAEFGACPHGPDGMTNGASTAAAHFSGHLARALALNSLGTLRADPAFRGRERILRSQEVPDALALCRSPGVTAGHDGA
ncbi:hypothetical protein [Ruegeria marina]|uniref:Subtilase family protein n=1 Tax=Ruegeria marina TaxID=639004 RepID=A0A1G6I5W7_9RHOB|nr:hypothetical protein [Ruegeria marina]SDC01831.1 hypothetical protein SAMN04488239_10133 [Ruegeria marina]